VKVVGTNQIPHRPTLAQSLPLSYWNCALAFCSTLALAVALLDCTSSCDHSFDLLNTCKEIGEGTVHIPELLGDIKIDRITSDGAYETKLESKRARNKRTEELLRRYVKRSEFKTTA